jgi:hypothetical protein
MGEKEVEKKMSDINQAYQVLSDDTMREQFDNGQDPFVLYYLLLLTILTLLSILPSLQIRILSNTKVEAVASIRAIIRSSSSKAALSITSSRSSTLTSDPK